MQHALLETLRNTIGVQNVIQGSDVSARYHCDWSQINPCPPMAVLTPRSVADVSSIMKVCHAVDQRVVVQGGMTGLCAGATPQTNEIAISLEKLSGIDEVDRSSMSMTVLAGTPLQHVQERAEAEGFLFPLDLGARGSCTIGGNIATNAGGTEVLQYGMARSLILGLDVVLPDGTVISSPNKMLKNNAGFDLKHLFIGTEGTLGIITRAIIRMFPARSRRSVAFCAVPNLATCIRLLQHLRNALGGGLTAFEVMWPDYIQCTLENLDDIPFPFDSANVVCSLVEHSSIQSDSGTADFEAALEMAMSAGLVTDVVIAQSEREAKNLWRIREAIGDMFQCLKNLISFDISVPLSSMEEVLGDVSKDLDDAFEDYTKITYGHLGDSNVHLTITTGLASDIDRVADIVYRRVAEYQGSISGEHGIGAMKRKYLAMSRSSAEIELMRKLKRLLDPKAILNADRVIP